MIRSDPVCNVVTQMIRLFFLFSFFFSAVFISLKYPFLFNRPCLSQNVAVKASMGIRAFRIKIYCKIPVKNNGRFKKILNLLMLSGSRECFPGLAVCYLI